MFNKARYWSRRKAGRRGQDDLPEPKLIEGSGKAPLFTIKGKQVHIPRETRRKIMRKLMTDLRKGRITMEELVRRKAENDRAKSRQRV